MTDEEKKIENEKKEKFEKIALILAVLLGMTHKSYDEIAEDKAALDEITAKIHENKTLLKAVESDEKLTDKETEKIKKAAAKTVKMTSKYMRVETAKNERVCEKCKPWQGKIICVDGTDKNYPNLDDYMKAGCFHVNCKCRLEPVEISENSKSDLRICFN